MYIHVHTEYDKKHVLKYTDLYILWSICINYIEIDLVYGERRMVMSIAL